SFKSSIALAMGSVDVPIVMAGLYMEGPSVVFSVLGIYFCIVPFSYITAYLRLITGSVWPLE
ncbi:hypothetical protein, partial [Escherichia coli]|uniref:hypothetical protein n=1 Tax=Escherichia coli TaxID=562 RepID=UPI001952F46C